MKIVDLQVIPFEVPRQTFWNAELNPESMVVQTLTRVVTDEGAEGYCLGGHGHGDQDGLTADEVDGRPPGRCWNMGSAPWWWVRTPGADRRLRSGAVLALDVGGQPA